MMMNWKAAHVIEECAELQQAICKAELFGWFNWHPDRPHQTNIEDVKREMSDVVEAIERLQEDMRKMEYQHFKEEPK